MSLRDDNPESLGGGASSSRHQWLELETQDKRVENKNDDREELALLEGQFINALLGLAPTPAHLDSEQVKVCGRSLKEKRARTINRLVKPDGAIENKCECGITQDLTEYFDEHPGVHPNGPIADLRRYKRFLAVRRIKAFFVGIKAGLSD